MAGLLTYCLKRAPSHLANEVTTRLLVNLFTRQLKKDSGILARSHKGKSQQRDCRGLAPRSLFIARRRTICGCKGTNKREQYKKKVRKLFILLSSESTFGACQRYESGV